MWLFLKNVFTTLGRLFLGFIADAFPATMRKFIAEYSADAIMICMELEESGLSGKEKAELAYKEIKNLAGEVPKFWVNTLVELAAAWVKNNLAGEVKKEE